MNLGIDNVRTAIVGIDLHRGHLDPAVATMPLDAPAATRVVAANRRLFDACRTAGIPIVHVVTRYRDSDEIRANAFWRTRAENPDNPRRNVLKHNLMGLPGCTIMSGLHDARDFVVDSKKRYDCFIGTDLDLLLRAHGINTLIVTGVNTNSCVLSTVAAACSRDYAVIVASDCVDTMDGPALHEAALACMRTAFGFVLTTEEILALPELGLGGARRPAAAER
jgi:biuret amidohydrolase